MINFKKNVNRSKQVSSVVTVFFNAYPHGLYPKLQLFKEKQTSGPLANLQKIKI